jgi:hypothetical protein
MREVGLAEIWAVFSVETSGCGFLTDRRPKILFERHIFSHLTNGRYDAQNPARLLKVYPAGLHHKIYYWMR